ncbi:MAG TPA: hypothetical protein VII56_16410 [Rhizomicrobium sp.]
MRVILFAAAVAALVPSVADAATWIATCNDGKNIQYNQTVSGNGFLYMKTDKGIYQVSRLTQTFLNGIAICGSVNGNSTGPFPITQICANKDRKIIYLKYQNPTLPSPPIEDAGTFCTADVRISP